MLFRMKLTKILAYCKNLLTITWLKIKDSHLEKKIQQCQQSLDEILHELRKNSINNKKLINLPWFLMIGPPQAGKTTLITHSHVNFILQKMSAAEDNTFNWWVSKDITLLDLPGVYLNIQNYIKKPSIYPMVWDYFLRSIKKQRGKNSIAGIILTLPLPELMSQNDPKRYQALLLGLTQRLSELRKYFLQTIPCYLIITKCDLLTGFKEFFAEASDDELNKAWGMSLHPSPLLLKSNKKNQDILLDKFNELIKKLN